MYRQNGFFVLAFVAAGVASLEGCSTLPALVAEDAGHASYMRQVVPILHGRKVRGHAEVELLSDLATLTSREVVLRALMQQPDYVDHWSEVFVDDLKVHREGERAQDACYGAPLRAGAAAGALATSVLAGSPSTSISPDFNMTDLLASSVKADNIYPSYAAHLFAMENRPGFDTELGMRTNVGSSFGQVYLHREMLCLTCHNSEYSLSGEASGWDRTHAIPGYFERALYGGAEGAPTNSAFAVFRTDVVDAGGIEPWGIDGCGNFDPTLGVDPEGQNAQFAGLTGQLASVFNVRSRLASGYDGLDADGLQRTLPPAVAATCQFCADNCSGAALDIAAVANDADNAAAVKTLLTATDWDPGAGNATCLGCHGGSASLDFTTGTDWANDLIGEPASQNGAMNRVEPGDSDNSYLIRKLEGVGMATGLRMPRNLPALSGAQITLVRDWIDSMPPLSACGVCATTDCGQPRNHVAPDEAFAYMTATTIVNNIWAEAMGAPLTIANYFPRNGAELQALRHLTEYRFIPRDWSPQSVLLEGLKSSFFNRKAPQFSALPSPYVVPLILDPWIEADPRVPPVSAPGYVAADHPENHWNGMGEGVYRYSARNLLDSIHEALDWPAPARFPSGGAYPNESLQRAIGQYFSDTSPGFRGVELQGLLFWESVHGACAKPPGVATDWIDRVVTAVASFAPAGPGGPLTTGDVVVVLRDWLLGNGTISSTSPLDVAGTEAAALAAYFGVADLGVAASSVPDLANKLRGYCGVLVETPQFMLAGIAPAGVDTNPRLRVCNSAPCSYQELCSELAPAVNGQLDNGDTLLCGVDSVAVLPKLRPPDELFVDWCIGPGCGLLVDFVPKGCFPDVLEATRALSLSCPVEPPACDVRCSRIDCCGGPLPPLRARGERPLLLAWAEGVSVQEAEGVKIRPSNGARFVPLKRGTQLRFGDLLAVPAGGKLRFKGALAEVATPKQGLPKSMPNGVLFISITGDDALPKPVVAGPITKEAQARLQAALPLDRIKRVQAGWASRGEGGVPLTYEQYKSYKYPEWELRGQRVDDTKQQVPTQQPTP